MNESIHAASNQRLHQRVQFFRLRTEEGFVPVFAFAPPSDGEAIAAIVVDLSAGGIQILCSTEDFVETSLYDCTLMMADQDQACESWVVRRVWSREEGMYLQSGFSFSVKAPVESVLQAQLENAKHHMLRCVLHPLKQVA
jgi:PilZ domain